MKSFKKTMFISTLLLLLIASVMAGCTKPEASLVSDKVNVVTSFYPLYDFTKKIGGDQVNVINLVPAGVEPHDWTPKGRDVQNISKAQMLVYLGAGFEGWVDDTVKSLPKDSKLNIVEASKGLSLIPSAAEDPHANGGDAKAKDAHPQEQWDPHVWLSPVYAKQLAQNIKDNLIKTDPVHQADYEANFKKFAGQLDDLHNTYKQKLSGLPKKDIVVSHQAFGYLAKEYGLTQKAIMGLSPDAEPTSKDMKDIIDFIKTNHVKFIFFEELVSDKLAKTLANDAKVETLVLNPLEGLTDKQMKNGEDYISVMNNNLNNLIKALQ